ncbi:MAG: hypothetical protein ACOX8W_02110 [bacterium]|jgi:hypothetical protein
MTERIRNGWLCRKTVSAAAQVFRYGTNVGVSGFSCSGCPKQVMQALSGCWAATGEEMKIDLRSGVSAGPGIGGALACPPGGGEAAVLSKR